MKQKSAESNDISVNVAQWSWGFDAYLWIDNNIAKLVKIYLSARDSVLISYTNAYDAMLAGDECPAFAETSSFRFAVDRADDIKVGR